MSRRNIVGTTLAALAGVGGYGGQAQSQSATVHAPPSSEIIPLWAADIPGGGGPSGPEQISPSGALTHISTPSVTWVRPHNPVGSAILIASGGGYKRIENGKEAYPAAEWLISIGVTAFILNYRLPREHWGAVIDAPFQDANRALRLIRDRASDFKIDPNRIGLLGFSAGGHLLGMQSTLSHHGNYEPTDRLDNLSAAPNLTLLAYPIVTLEPPYQHTSTRRILLGDDPDFAASAQWSVQTHIRSGLAPFFLTQAADDPISNPANTAILQAACNQAGVQVERHLFPSGGHGFGMGKIGTETSLWPDMAKSFLKHNGFI